MSRCEHNNCTIDEVAHECIQHTIEDGEYTGSWSSAGDILPEVLVECTDCGLKRRYSNRHKYLPKWVHQRLDSREGEEVER